MKPPVVLAVLIGTLVLACSTAAPAPAEPTPNIDATVEARIASIPTPTHQIVIQEVEVVVEPEIETIDQAFDLVIDHLENSSFDGENCLRLVMEQSEEAGLHGGPSRWMNMEAWEPVDGKQTLVYFSINRRFDRPGAHTEFGMQWLVYPDGRIEAQHKYPPC